MESSAESLKLSAEPRAAHSPQVRSADRDVLSLALMAARNRNLMLFEGFEPLQAANYMLPYAPECNLPLWELAHVGWFAEWWCLREINGGRQAQSLLKDADALLNSSVVPHRARWELALPKLSQTMSYLADSLELTLEVLSQTPNTHEDLYPFRLALLHEDMHAEAFAYTLQQQGLAVPREFLDTGHLQDFKRSRTSEAVYLPACKLRFGADPREGFCFDNEKLPHEISIPEFEIDASPVSWAQYLNFIEDGGYDTPSAWSAQGLEWLARTGRRAPRYVEQARSSVVVNRFGRQVRLHSAEPVQHLSWYEAQAYARWLGRRLPTEFEWEAAARLAVNRGFVWGGVFEWCSNRFRAYPGFSADRYAEYSAPWFGTHQSVRGASRFTSPRLAYPSFRNYYTPERDDVFIGFRTCSV